MKTIALLIAGLSILAALCIVSGRLVTGLLLGITALLLFLYHRLSVELLGLRTSLARLHQKLMPESDTDAEDDPSFGLKLSDPTEYGWNKIEVFPTKHRYTRSFCWNGPPDEEEVYQYEIRDGERVFTRLIDHKTNDYDGSWYEVVNGTVLKDAIKDHHDPAGEFKSLPSVYSSLVGQYRKAVQWHEAVGPEKHFILSKHLPSWEAQEFFSKELERLHKGFSEISAEAAELGATRDVGRFFPPKDADEETKKAVHELQTKQNLRRHEISFAEILDYDDHVAVLQQIIAAQAIKAEEAQASG